MAAWPRAALRRLNLINVSNSVTDAVHGSGCPGARFNAETAVTWKLNLRHPPYRYARTIGSSLNRDVRRPHAMLPARRVTACSGRYVRVGGKGRRIDFLAPSASGPRAYRRALACSVLRPRSRWASSNSGDSGGAWPGCSTRAHRLPASSSPEPPGVRCLGGNGIPDYAPSSSCDCRVRETGVQEATRRRFPGPGRRFAASGEPSRSIAFRVRSSDELGA